MESKVISHLSTSSKALNFPEPYDGRTELAANDNGKKWKSRGTKKLKGLVMHQELGWGSVENVAKYHTGADSHLYDGGVESIAYTWAIRRDGQVVLCNDFDKATWSQGFKGRKGDENAEFMSVMFEGLFHGQGVADPSAGQPNYMQMLAGLMLWHVCKGEWDWDCDDLYGHFLFGKAACPGDTLQTMIEAIRVNTEKPVYDFSSVQGRQQALKALGYYTKAVDGDWGPGSKAALIRFQSEKNLVADGIWGNKSEAVIILALKKL